MPKTNIYAFASEDQKVTVTEKTAANISTLYTIDKMKLVESMIGKTFTVEYTSIIEPTYIGDVHAYVYLKEFPKVVFDSVSFEDVITKSEEDKKHKNAAKISSTHKHDCCPLCNGTGGYEYKGVL